MNDGLWMSQIRVCQPPPLARCSNQLISLNFCLLPALFSLSRLSSKLSSSLALCKLLLLGSATSLGTKQILINLVKLLPLSTIVNVKIDIYLRMFGASLVGALQATINLFNWPWTNVIGNIFELHPTLFLILFDCVFSLWPFVFFVIAFFLFDWLCSLYFEFN